MSAAAGASGRPGIGLNIPTTEVSIKWIIDDLGVSSALVVAGHRPAVVVVHSLAR